MDRIDCVISGAGVIGLAVAREMANRGFDTLVLESENMIGTGTSSRNSEVIHAGIYYPSGSLKARLCVEGRAALYAYADEHGVPFSRCGKLIVACHKDQQAKLDIIAGHAAACGVHDLRQLSAVEAKAMEPELACTAALFSPSTGIIDSHGLMLALQGDAELKGATVAFNTRLLSGEAGGEGIVLRTTDTQTGRSYELIADRFINAGGLFAQQIAASIEGMPSAHIPKQYLAKGNYFSALGKTPFSHLIYPVPEDGGLGVHLTLDLHGRMRFGPDVEWIETVDYTVDPRRAKRFYAAIRAYWPALPDESLQPAYSGIRPKLSGPGEPAADFLIQGPKTHGIPGMVNLFGIESPGLTSCLAIAKYTADMVTPH
ncbi:NAD(P)/FAD-dependent oxidoreductase [Phyllobacterium salinisoli]|uniref:NAD(P)/FAD-dependent oxidoreductase n=1 Tax=Phyllobacterium salinisoli TaxID=1899321 RepID=A0A368K927_9HYPH|nr:NAD(P)/FAD-dependent oxidoreductase [Phyllobacterium salinisoli]RCS25741.1 NAD(P)/FAD-dependent oxidoreductase [Phyllobacterium salinisoli]